MKKIYRPSFWIFVLPFTIWVSACSTPESAVVDSESPGMDTDVAETSWFESEERVGADGETFSGYAVATASAAQGALESAGNLAENNLRFAIDRFAEGVRLNLAESDPAYGSRDFILSLRQAIRVMDLSEAEHHTEEMLNEHNAAVAHVKRALSKSRVIEILSEKLADRQFSNSLAETR